MSNTIQDFEAELLQKIQFKAPSKVSLDAFLFKAFKFFDLLNNGALSKNDFFRAIAKCGVLVESYNMDELYDHYKSEDGKFYYKNFIQQLLFREEEIESNNSSRHKISVRNNEIQNRSQLAASKLQEGNTTKLAQSKIDKFYSKCESYAEVLEYIKKSVTGQGFGALLDLAVKLKATDIKKTHRISQKTLQSICSFLQQEHLDLIFKELSQNKTQIDYSVLVYDLKGQVDPQRLKDVQNVFHQLDTRRQGEISIDYLLSRYLSKSSIENFGKSVDLYVKFQGIDDGVFTQDDFNDCLGFLSFDFNTNEDFRKSIIKPFYEEENRSVASQRSNRSREFQTTKTQPREEPYQQQIHGDFKKNKQSPASKMQSSGQRYDEFHQENPNKKQPSRYSQLDQNQAAPAHLQEVQSVLLRIKKRLASKGTKGFLAFQKAMKNADLDKDTLLSFEEFKQVVKDQRIDITTTETNDLFNVFDPQGTNVISFPQFIFVLRGKMPEPRRQHIQKLWNQVKLTQQTTNFSKIKKCLNFRNHPDVQNGRKYDQDIWKEIQETILAIQQLNGSVRSDTIAKAEFDQYLQNLSLSVIDDKLYESILLNFWRLQSSNNINQKYAGSRKVFDTSKNSYLMDHHRYAVKGGSVSQNAPFGTSHDPTNYLTQHRKL